MTLAEIYDAIMSIDATSKRIEANQIEGFERINAKVVALQETIRSHAAQLEDHSKQIAALRKQRHDLNGKLAPMFLVFSEEHPELMPPLEEEKAVG